MFAEAIVAVNRTVATGLERDHGVLAAFGADHGMHFTLALTVTTVPLVAAGLTARVTAFGLVGETLLCMIRA